MCLELPLPIPKLLTPLSIDPSRLHKSLQSLATMRFGTTLRRNTYPPWRQHYVDYDKLKKLLKDTEGGSQDGDDEEWTAEDESAFVDELMNVQLQKVHKFQTQTSQSLRDRTTAIEKKLEPLAVGIKSEEGKDKKEGEGNGKQKADIPSQEKERLLKEAREELDTITKEVNELEKFSRINYTAFYKATKKHDRKRGQSYRLRPFLETRLAAHPLNSEDYSPLLFRLSAMYSFVRQSLEGKSQEALSFADSSTDGEGFTSHKCMSPTELEALALNTNWEQSGFTLTTFLRSKLWSSAACQSSSTTRKPRK